MPDVTGRALKGPTITLGVINKKPLIGVDL
jgi:hypothetical protein